MGSIFSMASCQSYCTTCWSEVTSCCAKTPCSDSCCFSECRLQRHRYRGTFLKAHSTITNVTSSMRKHGVIGNLPSRSESQIGSGSGREGDVHWIHSSPGSCRTLLRRGHLCVSADLGRRLWNSADRSNGGGCSCRGSRSGALPETVTDRETGFLVEKNNPQALAQQILRLLKDDDLRERMGRVARSRVLSTFTWERVAGLMESHYRRLMSEKASAHVGEELHTTVAT